MPSFFADKNFLNTKYSMDIALEQHLSNLILEDEISRIIYASNEYALRKRARTQEHNNLNLPFLNYKLDDFDFGATPWWNNSLFSRGLYIPELGAKVRMSPVLLKYEATLWLHRDDETLFAFSELRFDADSKTTITASIEIGGIDVDFPGQLAYSNLAFDPQYNEMDWIERNKIHTIALDFDVITWNMKTNLNISIPKKVILEFQATHGLDDTISYEETINSIIDHFNETVTEETP